MVYVDSKGVTHVSLDEAKKGHAAKTTASRDATGAIVGDSIGSRYVRQQEEEKAAKKEAKRQQELKKTASLNSIGSPNIQQQQPQQQQQPKQQSSFLISPLNFIMPTARAQPQQPQPETPGFLDRMKNAFNQGYAAGEGKEYNLEGLTKPKTQAKDFYTYSLYEKANNYSKSYDAYQNSILSGLPSGSIKGFVTGVTNVPEILINTAGSIPLGLESIARNTKSSPETISLGLGTMAGSTVTKARNNPAELAGELIGTYGAGKAGGAVYSKVKPGLNTKGVKALASEESATFAPKLIYKEKPISEIKPNQINKVSLDPGVKLTPEMEQVLFSKGKSKPSAPTAIQNRNIFSKEMTAPSKYYIGAIKQPDYYISSIRQAQKAKPKNTIDNIYMDSKLKLTPEMETVIFSRSGGRFKATAIQKRNIFSKEMTAPSDYYISSIKQASKAAQKQKSSLAIPSFALPEQKQKTDFTFPSFVLPEQKQKTDFTIPSFVLPEQKQKTDFTFPSFDLPSKKDNPVIDPFIDPVLNPSIEPGSNPVFNDFKLPLMGGGWDISRALNGSPRSRRKTKAKTIKNAWGDPLKVNIKLKF